MAKTINNWCPQGIVHSVQMDCSFRRNDGKNDNRSNRNGTTLLALDCDRQLDRQTDRKTDRKTERKTERFFSLLIKTKDVQNVNWMSER